RRDWDYKNTIDFAHDKGFEEGREQGLAEGLSEGEAKGIAKGRAEGEARGRTEEQRTIAKRLLAAGVSVELVAAGTGLPIECVRALADA
ncbi:MAG: hypothetical protein J1D85_02725, partial [Bacteroidales bacterium]|nr:hypothetical protein [Bacteroidales bacterium]